MIKIGQVVPEKRNLTNDARRTPAHSNWSEAWIRWPNSLKCFKTFSKEPMFGSTAQQNDLSIKCLPDSTNKEGKVFFNNFFYYLSNTTVSFLLVWRIISFLEIGNDFCCQHLSYLHSPSPCSEEVKVTVINIDFK